MKFYPSIANVHNVMARKPQYDLIKDWIVQEKIDGMNMSIVFDISRDGLPELTSEFEKNPFYQKLELRGRTSRTDYDFSKVTLPSWGEFKDALEAKDGTKIILCGELCGGGIQKKWYFDKPTFVLFDIKQHRNDQIEDDAFYWEQGAVESIAKKLEINYAPVLGTTTLMIDSLSRLTLCGQQSTLTPHESSEGVVVKPAVEMRDKFGERMIYKSCFRYFT